MKRFALVNSQNVVENIVIWDGSTTWTPPKNMQLIDVENVICGIGWTYLSGVFVEPVTPEEVPESTTSQPTLE